MKPVPFTEIPADGKLTPDLVAEICDVSTFSEEKMFVSIDRITCPLCEQSVAAGRPPETMLGRSAIARCMKCRERFRFIVVKTPLGLARQARRIEEASR